MHTWLKKMMVALLALGIGQAAWADDVSDFRENLQAAEQGNAAAQFNLGVMYENGQGDAQAQLALGLRYATGQGVRQDIVIAKEWFGKACDNGLQQGCDAYRELNQAGY